MNNLKYMLIYLFICPSHVYSFRLVQHIRLNMSFPTRTEISIKQIDLARKLKYGDGICFLGSCFSENMATCLRTVKWAPLDSNPSHGILYNAVSLNNAVKRIISQQEYTEKDLMFNEDTGLWSSFMHHSCFSSETKEISLSKINEALHRGHKSLTSSRAVFVTLGTAWVFEYRASFENPTDFLVKNSELDLCSEKKDYFEESSWNTVGNCHKFPQKMFRKRLLTVDEIKNATYELTYNLLRIGVEEIILTVSPVRHLKDGPIESSRSRAQLLVSVHETIEKIFEKRKKNFSNNFSGQVSYFPSLELVQDDLRDYRYYARDMLHPSEIAIEYIWSKLLENRFDNSALALMKRIQSIVDATAHKPFNVESAAHQSFIKNQIKMILQIEAEVQDLDFSKEHAVLMKNFVDL